MSVVDDCVERILGDLDLGNKIWGWPDGYQGLPDIDEPDQERGAGVQLSPFEIERIESMRPHPGEIQEGEEGEEILGTYKPMSSPGVLTLHATELTSYFWHLVKDILDQKYYISKRDLKHLAYMVTMKTYTHEQFHHFCDVARHLFGSVKDRNMEEALAVAHSYLEITGKLRSKGNSRIEQIADTVYRAMLDRLFRFSQPGYRDWVDYRTPQDYQAGLISYLQPPATQLLERNGVSMGGILSSIQVSVDGQGVIESLIHH